MDRPREDIEVLLVEDNPGDARLIEHQLQSQEGGPFTPPSLTHVDALSSGLERLAGEPYDLVLLDLGLPESSGLATLDRYLEGAERLEVEPTPVVVLTGLNDDETALRAVQRGAQDYLVKDTLDGNVLHRTIRHALERHRQERELTIMKQVLTRVLRHNIRNDVSAIRGRSLEIAEQGDSPIKRHAEVIQELSDELVDVSEKARAVEAVVDYDGGPVRQSLAEAIDDAVASVHEHHPEASVAVEKRATPAVRAHPQLDLALENLLSATVDGADANGVAPSVVVEATGGFATVTVRGEDVTIPKTDVAAVQAGEETPLEHASGVGLWLVYLVVTRSEGTLLLDESDAVARVRLPTD